VNSGTGSVVVRATTAETESRASATADATVTFAKASQQIDFWINPSVFITNSPAITLAATNSSPLLVNFSSDNVSVASVGSNNRLNFHSPGTSGITALQPGNDNYLSNSVTRIITVKSLGDASFAEVYPDGLMGPDGNGDGITALVEYALGGNPFVNNTGIMPSLKPITNNTLTLVTLVRTSPVSNVWVTPVVATTLGTNSSNWSPNGFLQTNSTNQFDVPPGFVRREFTYTNTNNSPRVFLRLSISTNAP